MFRRVRASVGILFFLGVGCSAQDGSSIEVAQGDLHIVLQEAESKVYVSVQGGEEIELFDIAQRLATLEDSTAAGKAEMNRKLEALDAKIAALTTTSDDLVSRTENNGDTATAVQQQQDIKVLPALNKLQASYASQDTLLTSLQTQADAAAKALAVVPKMTECAADAKIYHPETNDCQPTVSVHCNALETDEHSELIVAGSRLTEPTLCGFNQHYGGQVCAALCPGHAVFKVGADGTEDSSGFSSGEQPSFTCASSGKWEPNFGCTPQTCGSAPTSDAASSSVKVSTQGAAKKDNTIGAVLKMECDGGFDVVAKPGDIETITCVADENDLAAVKWDARAFTASCVAPLAFELIPGHLGCHKKNGGNNLGFIGRPEVYLDDYRGTCRCRSNSLNDKCVQDCVELGKRACAAIDKQGKIECWGFAINAQEWGIQMYNGNAKHSDCGDNEHGLKPASKWNMYRKE